MLLPTRRAGTIVFVMLRAALLTGDLLDELLAAGVDPGGSAELRVRAARLTAPRSRRRIARTLRQIVDDAQHAVRALLAPTAPLRSPDIRAAAPELRLLARRLAGSGPVRTEGAALARLLITAPTSPIYAEAPPGTLVRCAREALAALR